MDTIKVIIRLVSANEDIEVDVPPSATAGDIIDSLLENNIIQRNDDAGNPITYRLTPKMAREIILEEDDTIAEAKIKEGDTILLTQDFIAGVIYYEIK